MISEPCIYGYTFILTHMFDAYFSSKQHDDLTKFNGGRHVSGLLSTAVYRIDPVDVYTYTLRIVYTYYDMYDICMRSMNPGTCNPEGVRKQTSGTPPINRQRSFTQRFPRAKSFCIVLNTRIYEAVIRIVRLQTTGTSTHFQVVYNPLGFTAVPSCSVVNI